MKASSSKLLGLGLVLALGACASWKASRPVYFEDKLKARAAFDLACPQEQLTITKLGDRNTAGVVGCDKRATYYNDDNDQWVMNTATGLPGAAPATATDPAAATPAAASPAPSVDSSPTTTTSADPSLQTASEGQTP